MLRKRKAIKCTGVFLDSELAQFSNIFHLTKYDEKSHFVHVMQHLDDVSWPYVEYPMEGWLLEVTGMEWWTAYLLKYLKNIFYHAHDQSLDPAIRLKFKNAWKMISSRHDGLCKRLIESNFDFGKVITLDWTEKFARIGTKDGAFN